MENLDQIISANKTYDIVYWLYVIHVFHEIPLDEVAAIMGHLCLLLLTNIRGENH